MGSKPKKQRKSAAQKELERYQLEDIRKLRKAEAAREEATARGRLGRASLLHGSRRGPALAREEKPEGLGKGEATGVLPGAAGGLFSKIKRKHLTKKQSLMGA